MIIWVSMPPIHPERGVTASTGEDMYVFRKLQLDIVVDERERR